MGAPLAFLARNTPLTEPGLGAGQDLGRKRGIRKRGE